MRAAILSIGSELMLGHITDSNASWLATDLAEIGIELVQVMQVGDDEQALARAMRLSMEVADVVICTGGIGPTDDDLTRETIAHLLGEEPAVDPDLLATVQGYFRQMGRDMPARNAKQAWLIPSAESIPNPVGTAPGWFVTAADFDNTIILTMPGVPREMYRMWAEQMRPRLLERTDHQIIDTVLIKTIGIGESDAEERIHDLILAGDPVVATYAKDDGVQIRVTAIGSDATDVRTRRDAARDEVRRILGAFIWGEDADSLASVIATELRTRDIRLRLHEIGTGGALASLFASDPSASDAYTSDLVEPMIAATGSEIAPIDDGWDQEAADDALVTVQFDGSVDELLVTRGTMSMSVRHATLDTPRQRTWQVRGAIADVQRRIGLNAVHELHDWLRGNA